MSSEEAMNEEESAVTHLAVARARERITDVNPVDLEKELYGFKTELAAAEQEAKHVTRERSELNDWLQLRKYWGRAGVAFLVTIPVCVFALGPLDFQYAKVVAFIVSVLFIICMCALFICALWVRGYRKSVAALSADAVTRAEGYNKMRGDIVSFNAMLNAFRNVLTVGVGMNDIQVPIVLLDNLERDRELLVKTARSHVLAQATRAYVATMTDRAPLTERFTQELTRQVFAVQLLQSAEMARRAVDPDELAIAAHDREQVRVIDAELEDEAQEPTLPAEERRRRV